MEGQFIVDLPFSPNFFTRTFKETFPLELASSEFAFKCWRFSRKLIDVSSDGIIFMLQKDPLVTDAVEAEEPWPLSPVLDFQDGLGKEIPIVKFQSLKWN